MKQLKLYLQGCLMVYMVDVIQRKNVLSLSIMIMSVVTYQYTKRKIRQSLIGLVIGGKFHIFISFWTNFAVYKEVNKRLIIRFFLETIKHSLIDFSIHNNEGDFQFWKLKQLSFHGLCSNYRLPLLSLGCSFYLGSCWLKNQFVVGVKVVPVFQGYKVLEDADRECCCFQDPGLAYAKNDKFSSSLSLSQSSKIEGMHTFVV